MASMLGLPLDLAAEQRFEQALDPVQPLGIAHEQGDLGQLRLGSLSPGLGHRQRASQLRRLPNHCAAAMLPDERP